VLQKVMQQRKMSVRVLGVAIRPVGVLLRADGDVVLGFMAVGGALAARLYGHKTAPHATDTRPVVNDKRRFVAPKGTLTANGLVARSAPLLLHQLLRQIVLAGTLNGHVMQDDRRLAGVDLAEDRRDTRRAQDNVEA